MHDKMHDSYYPLCIATIKIIHSETDENYLYIDGLCGTNKYCNCASHLMKIIKRIAYLYGCKEVRLYSVIDEHTLEWYRRQGFKVISHDEDLDYNHYYEINPDNDESYNRSTIDGKCIIIEDYSNLGGNKRSLKTNRNKKRKTNRNKKRKTNRNRNRNRKTNRNRKRKYI